MARPLRDLDPAHYHLITVRTQEARIWMVPSTSLVRVLGGILARYQEKFGMVLYAWVVLGNHLHLLVKAPEGNLDEFMENVLREIARRMNQRLERQGAFWGRRYDDQVIKSLDDLEKALLYVATNPVHHGLIRDIRNWPGLHCFDALINGTVAEYPFVFKSRKDSAGKPVSTQHTLTLTQLPQFAKLSPSVRREKLIALIDKRQEEIRQERRADKKGFLTADDVRRQIPGRIPIAVSRSPRPVCYTHCSETRQRYKADRREFRGQYAEASERFRLGQYRVAFPPYCFKPPLHRRPKQARAAA